ncbi:MAG: exodeoxyribonuclease V subunit gamma, partial [Planctomycetes bacterium]|nr:exodeoxyribonuclease V subunit gamma [Planctomycetota bacterium]
IGYQKHDAFLAAATTWIEGWKDKGGFPHLWIQLDVGLPYILMRRLAELLTLVDTYHPQHMHLHLIEPSPHYWGDLRSGKKKWTEDQDAGPLLTPFGKRLQDLQNFTIDLEWDIQAAPIDEDANNSNLLQRIQYSCQVANGDTDLREERAEADPSVSIHACRSPLRELEICRDRILQALDEDKDLQPNDILLLLTNPADYAPFVTAALQAQSEIKYQIPVHLLGLKGTIPSPLAEGIALITRCMNERFTQESLLALIEHPLIAEKFSLAQAIADGDDVLAWTQDACFRWGMNIEDRQQQYEKNDSTWSLAFALQRLAFGAIVDPAQRDGLLEGTAPLDRARGLNISTLAQVSHLLENLIDSKKIWSSHNSAPIHQWCDQLQSMIEIFFGPGDTNDQQQRAYILNIIIPTFKKVHLETALTASAFHRLLAPQLDDLTEGFHGGSGGVTVAPLASHAGTPARMVIICGLGSSEFPRSDERPDWHPLANKRQIGDPSLRDDDRHNFLMSILACQDRLVCTYTGGSDADDKILPPSTPLADFMYAIERCLPETAADVHAHNSSAAISAIRFTHGLNGFSPRANAAHNVALYKNYLPQDGIGAEYLNVPFALRPCMHGPWSDSCAIEDIGTEITLRELTYVTEKPCAIYARQLGLSLSGEESTAQTGDRLSLDSLELWSHKNQLLHKRVQAHADSFDEQAYQQRQTASGALPPGIIGTHLWDGIQSSTPIHPANELTILKAHQPVIIDDIHIALHDDVLWAKDNTQALHFFTASKLDIRKEKKSGINQTFPVYSTLLLRACLGGLLHATQQNLATDALHIHIHSHIQDDVDQSLHTIILSLGDQSIKECLQVFFNALAIARVIPLPMNKYMCNDILKSKDTQQALTKIAAKWDDGGGSMPPESQQALNQLCFRGMETPYNRIIADTHQLSQSLNELLDGDSEEPILIRYVNTFKTWMENIIIDGMQAAQGGDT